MGDRCNSSYKLALDVLHDADGKRLPCYDPYGDATTSFSLDGSEIFGGARGGPIWQVILNPDTPETANWGRVFRIKLRLEESLRAEFWGWLVEIGGFLRSLGFNLEVIEEVRTGLLRYKDACSLESLPGVALLKEGVASLLLQGLDSEDQSDRTHAFLRDALA